MKFTNLLTIALFVFSILTPITGQNEESIPVYQGTSTNVFVSAEIADAFIQVTPQSGNTLVKTGEVNGDFIYTYTPAPDFMGADYFEIVEILSTFPIPTSETHEYYIDVVVSMVDANDDFVLHNSLETISINPKANDESSADDLDISIAQVLNGTAVVNSDGNINYTPSSMEKDYIVYIATDTYGTSSRGTIYIQFDTDSPLANTSDVVSLSSGSSDYIFLPGADYEYQENELNYGTVEQVNDNVYRYLANDNVGGVDQLIFTDMEGHNHTVEVSVIEKYKDVGFVKDDVFYSASNTQTEISVKDNDASGSFVISDYSPELTHIGDGVFSYTPPEYFTGTKTFYYKGDNGTEIETGEITMVINNYKPANYFEYELSTPQNKARVLEYNVPIGTEYFEIASYPYHGTLEVFGEDESIDLECAEGIEKVFAVYTPNNGYEGSDNFVLRYCASDNNLCNEVSLTIEVVSTDIDECICVEDCVWPGDANGDGRVSVRDAVSIARYLGETGEEREASPFGDIYQGAEASAWGGLQSTGRSKGHVDGNGDGMITIADLDVVIENYGKLNSIVSTDLLGVKNLPFYFTSTSNEVDSGEVLTLEVKLGTEAWPAVDLHGISFAMNFPETFLDSSSVEVDFLEDHYFVKNAPFITLMHQPVDGQIHIGAGKTNGLGSTGAGIIAQVSFIVEEDAEGIRDGKKTRSNNYSGSENVVVEITDIVIEDENGFAYTLPDTSIEFEVRSNEIKSNTTSSIFPNPVTDILTVASQSQIQEIEVFSMTGNTVLKRQNIKSNESSIDVSEFSTGVFVLSVHTDIGIETHKFVKQ